MGGTFTLNFNEETSKFSEVKYSKTPSDFLSHLSYNIPKYAVWTSGRVSGEAKRTTTIPKGSMTIQINGIQLLQVDSQIVNDYAVFYQDFDTTEGNVFLNNENGYLTLSGNAIWTVTATAATPYLKNQTITVHYDYPKFIVLATAKDLKGNAQGGTITGDGEVEITQKGQQKTLTLTATAEANYNFVGWEDDESLGPTRTITLSESELTSTNTQKTYTALFAPKELYVGTKNVTAAYVGNKKAKVYRGTTRIL
jgi:hypothetical protein